ncbi:MAG: RNA-binding domain-containing protein [bacterium]
MRHSREEILKLLDKLDDYRAHKLESETLEFKEWLPNKNRLCKLLIEYSVCFANQRGGTIVLGVRDNVVGKDKAITGCAGYNIHEIRSRIYEATDPKILVDVEEISLEDMGVRLVLVHIPQGVGVHTTTDGTAKIRIGTDCKPMIGSMRQRRLVETGLVDITAQVVPEPPQKALDPFEIERLKRLIQTQNPNSPLLRLQEPELLEQVGIVQNNKPTLAGILLVGNEEVIQHYLSFHEVQYLRMRSEVEYERRETYTCGLLKALEEVYRNIELYNRIVTIRIGLFHYEIKDFPEETYREAVLNAVLHRDYLSPGSVFVKHYPNRLEVSNPGGFIAGVTPENILRQDSHPRNRHLAEILRRIGLIEKAGMGVKRMFYLQLACGKSPPAYWTDGHSVRVTLYNGTLDKPFVGSVKKREKEGQSLGLEELLVLSSLRHQRELSLPEAASLLQLDRRRTQEVLMQMVRYGLLERSGVRKGQVYRLSGEVYRLSGEVYRELGESVAYIREKGIDVMRYEELILEFVHRHGSITNRQVRELLGVNIDAAKRLLGKLIRAGRLLQVGKGRATHYVTPD